MKRSILLKELDKATDKAAILAIEKCNPIRISKKCIIVGNLTVEQNKSGLYDIIKSSKDIIYFDISAIDVAVIIAQRHNIGQLGAIKEVLYLEEAFTKHHTDMIHYLDVMKNAKMKNDNQRVAILEDKFQMAELSAKHVKNKIVHFKRVR